jgi:hypothetical protein
MLNEVKHLALSKRDSSASTLRSSRATATEDGSPQNDTYHLMRDGPIVCCS